MSLQSFVCFLKMRKGKTVTRENLNRINRSFLSFHPCFIFQVDLLKKKFENGGASSKSEAKNISSDLTTGLLND